MYTADSTCYLLTDLLWRIPVAPEARLLHNCIVATAQYYEAKHQLRVGCRAEWWCYAVLMLIEHNWKLSLGGRYVLSMRAVLSKIASRAPLSEFEA